jgi:hypothetical protein
MPGTRFRFIWTAHAEDRLSERGMNRSAVERAIRENHRIRETNDGAADWRVDTGRFVAIYDQSDVAGTVTICVVSVWAKRRTHLTKYK